ncbi:MAG: transcriptional regulator, partial [Clostridiales bacterium]
ISERQMSLDLGHSPGYINGITSGRKMPSVNELLYICDYLAIEPSEFFNVAKETTLLQQEVMAKTYQLSGEDTALILSFINRLQEKK